MIRAGVLALFGIGGPLEYLRPARRPAATRPSLALALIAILAGLFFSAARARAADGDAPRAMRSIADNSIQLPSAQQLANVLLLRDYNTRVVVIGVSFLGIAAGAIGTFMLLRRRALLGDALSHATLPGIGIAFLVMTALGGEGKWMPGLLLGASVSGVIGVLGILAIVHLSRIKEDAALGIVLSTFFGLGIVTLSIVQGVGAGNAAGLKSFIYGKTASMLWDDALLVTCVAALVTVACVMLFKEFAQLCFDQNYAQSQGWPVVGLDIVMMGLVVVVTVIGLQAVGLVLVIALLVIPPAAARFWTNHLPTMLIAAAVIGGVSGYVGAAVSALLPRLPAGAVIVLVAGAVFAVSMVAGTSRGVVVRLAQQLRLSRKIAVQHLLRALHELSEHGPGGAAAPVQALQSARSWSVGELRTALRGARRAGLVRREEGERVALTDVGAKDAARVVRNHRLWETYLITHADIAPSHVDRDADAVEHVLSPEMIAELEARLAHDDAASEARARVPQSPHMIETAGVVGAATGRGGR